MAVNGGEIGRRDFLRGKVKAGSGRGEPGAGFLHIASAVVTVRPELSEEVSRRLAELPQTEVSAVNGSKIVVVMESTDGGEIGSRLVTMSLMDGVFSANLVFEQIEFEQIEALDGHGAGL